MVQQGQNSIMKYLELTSMGQVTPKHKPNCSEVLGKPGSDFKIFEKWKTTEVEKVTQVVSKTAEGREKYSIFVREDAIGQDKDRVGKNTNYNQL